MAAHVPSTTHGDCPGSPSVQSSLFPFVPRCSLALPPQGGCSAQRVRAGDPNACSSHRFRPAALPQTQAACCARASLLPRSIRDAKPASCCPAWSAGGDHRQNGGTPRCSSSKHAPTSSCVQTPCLQSSKAMRFTRVFLCRYPVRQFVCLLFSVFKCRGKQGGWVVAAFVMLNLPKPHRFPSCFIQRKQNFCTQQK